MSLQKRAKPELQDMNDPGADRLRLGECSRAVLVGVADRLTRPGCQQHHPAALPSQDGRCRATAALLTVNHRPQTPCQCQRWLTTVRPTITIATTRTANTDEGKYRLTPTRCFQHSHPALLPANKPTGLARAGCRETGTSGSEGVGRSNVPDLPAKRASRARSLRHRSGSPSWRSLRRTW